jgi:hypothetical protein
VTLVTAALACGPAAATTVGGNTLYTNGSFVLAAGRLALPTFVADDPGMDGSGPPTNTPSVLSFAVGNRDWSTLQVSSDGDGTPALASNSQFPAIASLSPLLQSALLTNRHLVAPATHSTSGTVRAFDVAIASDSTRATVWSDADGVRLQTVGAGGAVAPAVLLSPESAGMLGVVPAGGGAWWVLWRTSTRLFARHVGADGAVDSTRDLAAADATKAPRAPFLDPSGRHVWTAVADGRGNLWVGLPRRLLLVTATGVSTVRSSARPLVLAAGGGRVELASRKGRRDVVLGVLAGGVKRTIALKGLGEPIAAGVDAGTATTYLLSSDAKGNVRLSEIARDGKHRSITLSFCHRRRHGQVAAADGLVAVACAGRYVSRDSVETGGDFSYGRNQIYALMRAGKVLRRQSLFEGIYSY